MAAEQLSPDRLLLVRNAVEAVLPDTHFALVVTLPFIGPGEGGDAQGFTTANVTRLGMVKILTPLLAVAVGRLTKQNVNDDL